MKTVIDLEAGDLFMWDVQPQYLHQMTDQRDPEDDRPFAHHIATLDDNGKWRFHLDGRGNKWNPYCNVTLITLA